jgi:hypothetical protein
MADYVRARITAAKVGVGLAIAGVLAGVVERVRPQQPEGAMTLAAHTLAQKIDSSQVKDHTLLYKDIKAHQVLPYAELITIKKLKADGASLKSGVASLKSSLNQTNAAIGTNDKKLNDALAAGLGGVYNKVQADSAFLSKAGTASNAAKLSGHESTDFVNGHGNVFSGVQHIANGEDAKELFTVPGIVTVNGNFYGPTDQEVQILNLTSAPLTVSWNDGADHGGFSDQQAPVPAGSDTYDLPFGTTNRIITAQLLAADGHPVTFTVSFIPDQTGNQGRFVGQALAAP